MKVTDIAQAVRSPNRVNIFIDGSFRFSLDIFQVGELGVKIGKEYTESGLIELETESQFGKLYARALEYTMLRPHSSREVLSYLERKTRDTKYKSRKSGKVATRAGVSKLTAERVYDRLSEKGFLDDDKFAHFWIEHRNQKKGISKRKLQAELALKGVSREIVEKALSESERNDQEELKKIIEKKRSKYTDYGKFMAYLARQGFSYDDIKSALNSEHDY